MNEYKELTDREVTTLYREITESVKNLSSAMSINDRLYLQQRQVKLRNEVLRRLEAKRTLFDRCKLDK